MITEEKLNIYQAFRGDGDFFSRSANQAQHNLFDYTDWSLIGSLLQDIQLIRTGYASLSYIKETEAKIGVNCDNEKTARKLYELPNY